MLESKKKVYNIIIHRKGTKAGNWLNIRTCGKPLNDANYQISSETLRFVPRVKDIVVSEFKVIVLKKSVKAP